MTNLARTDRKSGTHKHALEHDINIKTLDAGLEIHVDDGEVQQTIYSMVARLMSHRLQIKRKHKLSYQGFVCYSAMREVVYAIRISHLEYSGLKIMDIKIGKSTDIENTLRQYSRGNRDIELLDMWTPNPDKTLSTAERGVHTVAEKYAYDKQSEKFVFLQDAYQEFAEIVNIFLQNVSREDIAVESTSRRRTSGMTPPRSVSASPSKR